MSDAPQLETRPMAGFQLRDNPLKAVQALVTDLDANRPQTLGEARTKLEDLLRALHKSNDAMWASSRDKQAILADVAVGVEAAGIVTAALAGVRTAQDTADAALARVLKAMHAPRTEQRVWRKLRPTPAADAPAADTATATTTEPPPAS